MHNNFDTPNLDVLAQLNEARQAELQQAARQERALQTVAGEGRGGLQQLEHFVRAETQHLVRLFHLVKQPPPTPKHRHG